MPPCPPEIERVMRANAIRAAEIRTARRPLFLWRQSTTTQMRKRDHPMAAPKKAAARKACVPAKLSAKRKAVLRGRPTKLTKPVAA